jgi:outer membrane immunogenic protein
MVTTLLMLIFGGCPMRRLLLASSAIIMAGPALAADIAPRMSVKAPVVAAVPYSWSGCYVGGHVGAGWSRTNFFDPGVDAGFGPSGTIGPAGTSLGVDSGAGVIGGAQAGCDYQFASNWVIGIGGDFSAADLRGVLNDPFFGGKNGQPATLSSRTEWIASVTGRLGYTWDHVLVYGKGGAAFSRDRYSLQNFVGFGPGFCVNGVTFVGCNATTSADRFGWTAGVGVEWAFAPNWSALLEYDHYGFGSKDVLFVDPNAVFAAPMSIKQNIDVVKVGINYRFGGNPVVARY